MLRPEDSTPSEHESRILVITGAAGRVGSFYRRWLHERGAVGDGSDQWRLRLVDIREPEDVGVGDEVVAGDDAANLAELEIAQRVTAGAHSVLHLATDPSPRADFYGSLLDRNVKAPYNVLQAALDAGVKRVIVASSINAVNGHPVGKQVRAEDVAWPGNVYGATKAWGEALCGAFVTMSGGTLSAIAVRIGGVRSQEQLQSMPPGPRPGVGSKDVRSSMVSLEDLSRLFDCCLAAGPEVTFAVVNGVSSNLHLRLDLESTRRLTSYAPVDDAFSLE